MVDSRTSYFGPFWDCVLLCFRMALFYFLKKNLAQDSTPLYCSKESRQLYRQKINIKSSYQSMNLDIFFIIIIMVHMTNILIKSAKNLLTCRSKIVIINQLPLIIDNLLSNTICHVYIILSWQLFPCCDLLFS